MRSILALSSQTQLELLLHWGSIDFFQLAGKGLVVLAGYVFHGKCRALPAILPWIGIGNHSYGLLVAFDKYKGHSAEAGAKFILSALFSSGIFLYGISMIYGTTGTLYFEDIPAELTGTPLQVLALVFFFSGLAFKLSLVPFHLWTADTYQVHRLQ